MTDDSDNDEQSIQPKIVVDSPEHQRTEPDPSIQQTLNETAELAELMDEERADFDMQWAELRAYRSICDKNDN